jgi:radical SAM superfamily enzyme YgiQ (UPF0313 family)
MSVKLVLSTSPHIRHAAVLQSDFQPEPSVPYVFAPLGLLSLAAVVNERSPRTEVALYDLNRRIIDGQIPLDVEFYRAIAADIAAHRPDVVGFMTECDSYHHILQIATALKASSACKIVLGGPHASAVAHRTMERCQAIDAIVIGEGEATLPELLDVLASPGTALPVAGALVRAPNGDVLAGGARELLNDLDSLPLPKYELYKPAPGEELFLEVGRGCPFQCTFCSTAPFWKRKHRVKSPERVLREVMLVKELFGAERVHFTHDLFTTSRSWVSAICQTLTSAGTPIEWTCSARTDTVDEELLSVMSAAGCKAIYFGFESGSERILREIRKDIPLDQSFAAAEACQRNGITPNVGLIAGFPSEDAESLRATFQAFERALRLDCRPTHIFGYCPFTDSSMYGTLRSLECPGHFVDLPLGAELDRSNREYVASDSTLFGALFRPRHRSLIPGSPHAAWSLDEFSPLVEATLVPALALAECVGGMHEVFARWVAWVQEMNAARGAAPFRLGYASARDFARFLLEQLELAGAAPASLDEARAVKVNLEVAHAVSATRPTSMATHRSFHAPNTGEDLRFDHTLALGGVLRMDAFDHDVRGAIAGNTRYTPVEVPTFLVWQRTATGAVRLLRVDDRVFHSLELVRCGANTFGRLMLDSITQSHADPGSLSGALISAAREGLLLIEDPNDIAR